MFNLLQQPVHRKHANPPEPYQLESAQLASTCQSPQRFLRFVLSLSDLYQRASLLAVVHTDWHSRSQVRCWDSSWVVLLDKDRKHPAQWGLSFRITHWSLSQYTLPSWSKGHKQGLRPRRRSLFSTRFKVNLLFFFPRPMKRQLFSTSGTGPQMKKRSQNKEENSVTPKYCKIGFTIQGLKQRSTQTSRVTGYNRQGRVWWVFFNKSNLTCWKPTGTKKFTAVFYSWKAQLPGLPRTVRWFSSFLTS